MKTFSLPLLRRENIAADTLGFLFEKPIGFEFKAGQFVELSLINPLEMDSGGPKRELSIASAPHERELLFTMRMRNTAFKRVLGSAALGTVLKMEGPFGDFTLPHDSSRPLVFLTGGIGITPFHSMVMHAAHEHLPHKIFLFYSNRTPEDAAFLDELRVLESQNPNYHFMPTMTRVEASSGEWSGERGRITAEMLKKYIGTLIGPRYYSAGPQGMVAGMRRILNDAGVDDDDIRTEEFSGY